MTAASARTSSPSPVKPGQRHANPPGLTGYARAVTFVCALFLSSLASATEVLIGWAGPTSPEHALVQQRSAQLAVDDANRRKIMLDGEKLTFRLLTINDKDNPNFSRYAATGFVRSHVVAVIGHYSTDATLAAMDIYAKANMPVITVFANGPQVTETGYDKVFQLISGMPPASDYMAQLLVDAQPNRRIAIAYANSMFGETTAASIDDAFRKQGNALVAKFPIGSRTSDFSELLAIVQRQKIDTLIFLGFQEQVSTFAMRVRAARLNVRLMLTNDSFNPDFIYGTGDYPDGTMILTNNRPEEQAPGFARFEKAYVDKHGTSLMPYAVNAYDAVNLIVQAITTGKSLDPATIAGVIHGDKFVYHGLSGKIAFDKSGRLLNPGYSLYQAEGGKWKLQRVFP